VAAVIGQGMFGKEIKPARLTQIGREQQTMKINELRYKNWAIRFSDKPAWLDQIGRPQ